MKTYVVFSVEPDGKVLYGALADGGATFVTGIRALAKEFLTPFQAYAWAGKFHKFQDFRVGVR